MWKIVMYISFNFKIGNVKNNKSIHILKVLNGKKMKNKIYVHIFQLEIYTCDKMWNKNENIHIFQLENIQNIKMQTCVHFKSLKWNIIKE